MYHAEDAFLATVQKETANSCGDLYKSIAEYVNEPEKGGDNARTD